MRARGVGRPPPFGTVRARATAASVGIVAVALVIAAVALLAVLRSSQLASIDRALEIRADDIDVIFHNGAGARALSGDDEGEDFVQVLDTSGAVVASSENIAGRPPIVAGDDGSTSTMRLPGLDSEDFRVHVHVTEGDPALVIVVGTSLEDVDDVTTTAGRALLVGLPMLLLLIAALTWVVIGRALRPVEAIRSEVADIGGGDLHRRVPEPTSDDEIGRLARTMNAMLDRLEVSNNAQARFVSDASHELRTPIAVIRHELEVGLRADDDSMLREIAGEVLLEDLRMQRLVDDLLLLARRDGQAGRPPSALRSLVDLDDIAAQEAHRVTTDKTVSTSGISAGQVRGDPDQLARVVRNLLDNALRHAASQVAVGVTSTGDGRVLLTVDDDGAGVADGDRERIFERFGRLDQARARDDGGSGLGLAIVAGIVADHGGTISVGRSPALGGARFTVALTDARL